MTLTERIIQCRKEDEENRAKYSDYPGPDEIDELDQYYLDGKITEENYYKQINAIIDGVTQWFSDAKKNLDKTFAPYLEEQKI